MSAAGRAAGGGAVRPSIPVALWVAAGVWCGSAAGSLVCWALAGREGAARSAAVLIGAGAALTAVTVRRARRTGRPWARADRLLAVLLALSVAACGALLRGAWALGQGRAGEAGVPRAWTGTVVADPLSGSGTTLVTVRLDDGALAGRYVLRWPEDEPVPDLGRTVRFSARLRALVPATPGGLAAFLDGNAGRATPWVVRVDDWAAGPFGAIARSRAGCLRALAALGRGGRVAAAAAFGRRDPAEEESFRAVGAAHLLMASGLHLAVIAGAAAAVARAAGARRGVVSGVACATALGFCVAGGLRTALVRASLVTVLAVLADVRGRRRSALAAGSCGVATLIVIDPPAAFDAALWVGAAACAGAALFSGLVREWLRPIAPWRARGSVQAVATTIAVQAAVAPIASALFGAVTPLAPISTIAITPAVQIAVGSAVMASACGGAGSAAGRALLRVAAMAGEWAAAVAATLCRAGPPAIATGAWGGVAIAVWLFALLGAWSVWPRPRRAWRVRAGATVLAIALVLWSCVPGQSGAPSVVVFDVGQGDAVLIRDGRESLLVDAGPSPLALRSALARSGVRAIEGLVLTHDHADHTAGVRGLGSVVDVGWVGSSGTIASDGIAGAWPEERACAQLRAGCVLAVGAWRVRVLAPPGTASRLETNDASVILLAERPGCRVLLLGDGEARAQEMALRGFDGHVDVLKVAHHGSANGIVERALAAWRPDDAIISVGAGNRFGHPAPGVVDALVRAGARVWRTDLHGDVTIEADGRSHAVRTSRRGAPATACATIWRARATPPLSAPTRRETHGLRPVGPQAGLPDLRLRGAAAGARGPPPARPLRAGW